MFEWHTSDQFRISTWLAKVLVILLTINETTELKPPPSPTITTYPLYCFLKKNVNHSWILYHVDCMPEALRLRGFICCDKENIEFWSLTRKIQRNTVFGIVGLYCSCSTVPSLTCFVIRVHKVDWNRKNKSVYTIRNHKIVTLNGNFVIFVDK